MLHNEQAWTFIEGGVQGGGSTCTTSEVQVEQVGEIQNIMVMVTSWDNPPPTPPPPPRTE